MKTSFGTAASWRRWPLAWRPGGGSNNNDTTARRPRRDGDQPRAVAVAAEAARRSTSRRRSGSELAFDQKTLSAKAGSVTIDFDNTQSLPHDVAVETRRAKTVGQTDLVSSGTANATVDLQARAPTRSSAPCPATARPACRER